MLTREQLTTVKVADEVAVESEAQAGEDLPEFGRRSRGTSASGNCLLWVIKCVWGGAVEGGVGTVFFFFAGGCRER